MDGEATALLFFSFASFAIGSGALTAWGRASFGTLGIANANASRYTLFSSYIVYALIYAACVARSDNHLGLSRLVKPVLVKPLVIGVGLIFLACAFRSFSKSVAIYSEAQLYNERLATAFLEDSAADQKFIYPDADRLKDMESELRRMRIGPDAYGGTTRPAQANLPDALDELAAHKLLDEFGVDGVRSLP